MIIDWVKMKPHIPGEAEDATGKKLPRDIVAIDTETGWVTLQVRHQYTNRWKIVPLSDGGERIKTIKVHFVPPITVWLYT